MFVFASLTFVLTFFNLSGAALVNLASNLVYNSTSENFFAYYRAAEPARWSYIDVEISHELIIWDASGGACVDDSNSAPWAAVAPYQDPQMIAFSDSQVRIYFAAQTLASRKMAIGVLLTDLVLYTTMPYEPYYRTLSLPLVANSSYNFVSPSVALIPNQLPVLIYLCTDTGAVHGVLLSEDGLQVRSRETLGLISPSLDWEEGGFTKTWAMHRGGFVYIFFVAADNMTVGVARSEQPLGSYEKFAKPIARLANKKMATTLLEMDLVWGDDGWPSFPKFYQSE